MAWLGPVQTASGHSRSGGRLRRSSVCLAVGSVGRGRSAAGAVRCGYWTLEFECEVVGPRHLGSWAVSCMRPSVVIRRLGGCSGATLNPCRSLTLVVYPLRVKGGLDGWGTG